MFKKIITLFSIFILVFSVLSQSLIVHAVEGEMVTEEDYQLFQLKEDLEIEEGFILKEGFVFFGIKEAQDVKFQFKNEFSIVELEKLEELTNNFDDYIFSPIDHEVDTNVTIEPEKTKILSNNGDQARIDVIQKFEYPSNDSEHIIIGNVSYLLEQTDIDYPIEDSLPEEKTSNDEKNEHEETDLIDEQSEEQSNVIPSNETEKNSNIITEENIASNSGDVDNKRKSNKNEVNLQIEIASSQPTFKKSDRFMRVTENVDVYIRKNGKLTVVGTLKKGQIYPRYEASTQWHEIQYGSDRAFVRKDNTVPVTGSTVKNINNTYNIKRYENTFVANSNIEIYDNSSGSLVSFGQIKAGETYTIAKDYGGKWLYVVFADRIGYVDSSKVNINFKSSDKYMKATADIPVYLRVNGKLKEVATLKAGEIYPRYEASPNWHHIQYGSDKAFVKKENTVPVSKASIKNLNNQYSIKNYESTLTALEDVNVYDNSSGSLKPFGTIKKGEKYTVARDYGGTWIYVVFSDRIGFVDSSKVKTDFNENYRYFRVIEDNVPVYDNRSGRLVEVASLEKGQVFERRPTRGQWHSIDFGHYTGYVHTSQTEVAHKSHMDGRNDGRYRNTRNSLITQRDTIVYDNSSGSIIPVAKIKAGQNYPVARDYGGSWIYIIIAGKLGLVKSTDVQVGYFVTAPEIKLYSSYSDLVNYTQQRGIDTLYYGETVKILETRNYAARVETQSGRTGWVHLEALDNDLTDNWWFVKDGRVLRASASANSSNIGSVPANSRVKVLEYRITNDSTYKHWYKIRTTENKEGWIWGGGSNGRNVIQYEPEYVDGIANHINIYTPLNSKTTFTASQINSYLAYKTNSSSYMYNMGSAYIAAQNATGLNAIYLVAHSALETGFGTSNIVKDKYNYFGIGAFDACPAECASNYEGKRAGIIEGAAWISRNYVNSNSYKQFTLDSMRNNNNSHQYATDEAWHVKISNIAKEMVEFITGLLK